MDHSGFIITLDPSDPVVKQLLEQEIASKLENKYDNIQKCYRISMMNKIVRTILQMNYDTCNYKIFGGFVRDTIGNIEPNDIDIIVTTERLANRIISFEKKVNYLIEFLKSSIEEILEIEICKIGIQSCYGGFNAEICVWSPFHEENKIIISADLVMESIRQDIDFDVNGLHYISWNDPKAISNNIDVKNISKKIKERKFSIVRIDEMNKLNGNFGSMYLIRIIKKALRIGKMILRGWILENRNTKYLEKYIFASDSEYKNTICKKCSNTREDWQNGFVITICCENNICLSCLNQYVRNFNRNKILSCSICKMTN